MVLKKLRERLATPVSEIDARKLRDFCAQRSDCTPIADVAPRAQHRIVGQIGSLRIVPHDGSPWLEATISDGTGSIVALWTGRRRIAGIAPGRRLVVSGRLAPQGGDSRLVVYNPQYELLA